MNYFRIGSFKKYNSTLRTYYFTPSVHIIKKNVDKKQISKGFYCIPNLSQFMYHGTCAGEEFHYQLENEITFVDEIGSCRGSCTTRVLELPPRIPPRSVLKVPLLYVLVSIEYVS